MNNSLQIVGHANSLLHGWLWENGTYYSLPDLNGGDDSTVNDINEAGVIVGNSYIHQAEYHAVRWVDRQAILLPVPLGTYGSKALGINNAGAITGAVVSEGTFESQASLWVNDQVYLLRDRVTNLGDWQLRGGIDIDEFGRIFAFGHSDTYSWQRLFLTPVPERRPACSRHADSFAGGGGNGRGIRRKGRYEEPICDSIPVISDVLFSYLM